MSKLHLRPAPWLELMTLEGFPLSSQKICDNRHTPNACGLELLLPLNPAPVVTERSRSSIASPSGRFPVAVNR